MTGTPRMPDVPDGDAPDVILPGTGPGSDTRKGFVDSVDFEFSPGSLVGSWFHRLENDLMVWQGVIVAEPAPGVFLAQIDKLDHGAENVQRLVTIQQLINDEDGYDWRFYDSEAEAKSAYGMWVAAERVRV